MGWEAEKKCCNVVNSQGQHKHREVGGEFCLISRHNIMKMNGERDFRGKKKKDVGKEEWVTAGVWCGSRPCSAVVLVPQSIDHQGCSQTHQHRQLWSRAHQGGFS